MNSKYRGIQWIYASLISYLMKWTLLKLSYSHIPLYATTMKWQYEKKIHKSRERKYEKLYDRFMLQHCAFEWCCINNVLTNIPNVLWHEGRRKIVRFYQKRSFPRGIPSLWITNSTGNIGAIPLAFLRSLVNYFSPPDTIWIRQFTLSLKRIYEILGVRGHSTIYYAPRTCLI